MLSVHFVKSKRLSGGRVCPRIPGIYFIGIDMNLELIITLELKVKKPSINILVHKIKKVYFY